MLPCRQGEGTAGAMSFVKIESWEALPVRAASLGARSLVEKFDRRLLRGVTIFLSAVVHAALIWLLINRPMSDVMPKRVESVLKLINLTSLDGAAAKISVQAPAAAPSKPTTIETTKMTDPPPEWSMTRIRVAQPAIQAPAASPSLFAYGASASANMGQGNGAGREAGYDPYAGAAPLPLRPRAAASIGPSPRAQLDEAMFRAVQDTVARRLGANAGLYVISARLSRQGEVIGIEIMSGSADRNVMSAFQDILIGKRLYTVMGDQLGSLTVQLPPIRVS